MNTNHHGINLFMSSIYFQFSECRSQSDWNTRNHSPYEYFYV